jgi:single-stranded DNA-binding protein
MTVRTLLLGVLADAPVKRTGATGRPYTTAKLRASDGQKTAWVDIVAFGSISDELAALKAGDSVSVSGRAEPKAWIDKAGAARASLDVVADAVLSIEGRKPKAPPGAVQELAAQATKPAPSLGSRSDPFEEF